MPRGNESSDTRQTIQAAEESEVSGSDSSAEKLKPQTAVRGRRAKMEEAISVEEKAPTNPEESAISAPVRGRRGRKAEAAAPPVAQKSTRSRTAKSSEKSAAALSVNQCSTLSSNMASKPRRGRNAKNASSDPAELIPEVVAEAEIAPEMERDQAPSSNDNQDAHENLAALEKPRRERRPKHLYQPVPESKLVPLTPRNSASRAGKGLSETDATIILKKSGRGKRAKVEVREVEDNQVVPDDCENPIDPGNSKRGQKTEVTQQPILRQTTRSRNAKLQESKVVLEEKVQVTQVSEVNAEAERVDGSTLGPTHREAATKPTRGRRTKRSLAHPEEEEAVSEEQPRDDDKPEKPSPPPGKNTRGKRTKTDDLQTAAVEESKQKSAPPLRAKRGRINKEESVEETSQSREPAKRLGRTRTVEQDPVEPSTVQNNEQELSKEAEAPVDAKPTNVKSNVATRARRAQNTARVQPLAESDDVRQSAAISVSDRPTRGRRGKQAVEDVSTPKMEEKPQPKAEDENNKGQEETLGKRRAKSNVPETIPAKRARRGASLPPVEPKAGSADLGSKPESNSKELPKRGRRVAKPLADIATLSAKELKTALVEDARMPMKSVKWKSDVEVFEIQEVRPVKPVRGRKSKVGDKVDGESQKDSSQIEEKHLSDEGKVQATKRTRRGGVIVEATSKGEHVEPETQPKTRRGRLAKQ